MRRGSAALADKVKRIARLVRQLKAFYEPGFTPPVVEVDVDWVARRLERLPNWQWWRWLPLDARYYTTTLDWWRRIIEWDSTNRKRYVVDRFDCDKYAIHFKANVAWYFGLNAVAVVLDYDAMHAYNLVFPAGGEEPLILEPQADALFPISARDTRFYRLGRNYLVVL